MSVYRYVYEMGWTNHDSEDLSQLIGEKLSKVATCSSIQCVTSFLKKFQGKKRKRSEGMKVNKEVQDGKEICPDCGSYLFWARRRSTG